MVLKFPSTNPASLADDVQMLAMGKANECAKVLAAATKKLVNELEGVCLLTVPIEKLALVASTPMVANEIMRRYSLIANANKNPVRNLGVYCSAGGVAFVAYLCLSRSKKWKVEIARSRRGRSDGFGY